MTFDREEHDRQLERQLQETARRRKPELERSVRVGGTVEQLTGTPEWDLYIGELQALVEVYESEKASCEAALLGPEVSYETLLKAKVKRAGAAGALHALGLAMGLPKQLIERGKQSKAALPRD
jgi:hypothetical protein